MFLFYDIFAVSDNALALAVISPRVAAISSIEAAWDCAVEIGL
jgi:hypothetical protein